MTYWNRLRQWKSLCLFTLTAIAVLSSGAEAKNFISFNGQFYLSYPDTWEQIDYRSVDFFLTQNNPDPNLLKYEAVFAPASERPFYEEPYLLLTFDSTGELIGRSRDSAIDAVASAFGQKIDSVTFAEVAGRIKADLPLYVTDKHMVLVQTDMHEGRVVTRRNLLAVRYTQTGVANFYFYASDSAWAGALPLFLQVSGSLTEGTTPAGAAKESVKIADISTEPESKTDVKKYWPIPSSLIVVFIAIMAARRRRLREQKRNAASS